MLLTQEIMGDQNQIWDALNNICHPTELMLVFKLARTVISPKNEMFTARKMKLFLGFVEIV